MTYPSPSYLPRITIQIILTVLIALTISCGSDPEPPSPPPLPQVNTLSPTSGLTNTQVVIAGANFSTVLAENKVTFNGKEAVITVATTTQLTTTVPLLAETGPVVVTTKGQAASNKPVFVVESPAPEVTTISPAAGLTNTPVTITGTNFSTVLNENQVTFNGKDAVVSAATVTQLTVTVPLSTETGPVIVTVKGKSAVNQPVFTVLKTPVLTTSTVKDILQTTAVGGGTVTSEGGAPATARGICWSTNENPTILDNKTLNGTGSGVFTSSITGLTVGITYYVRAYATNAFGTAYGNEVTFKSPPLIGVAYQGGVIGYILQPGDPGYIEGESHGIISSLEDQSPSVQWIVSDYVVTGANATALGTGLANTTTIIAIQGGGNTAPYLCFDFTEGIYEDWYLPSKDELNKLYIARDAIGGFTNGYYWSSSENTSTAWIQNFSTGVQSTYDKKGDFNVRAIRSF